MKDPVIYVCNHEPCPNNKKQKLYCNSCLIKGGHVHFPADLIIDKLNGLESKWSQLVDALTKLQEQAVIGYEKYKPLINYLEEEMLLVPPQEGSAPH